MFDVPRTPENQQEFEAQAHPSAPESHMHWLRRCSRMSLRTLLGGAMIGTAVFGLSLEAGRRAKIRKAQDMWDRSADRAEFGRYGVHGAENLLREANAGWDRLEGGDGSRMREMIKKDALAQWNNAKREMRQTAGNHAFYECEDFIREMDGLLKTGKLSREDIGISDAMIRGVYLKEAKLYFADASVGTDKETCIRKMFEYLDKAGAALSDIGLTDEDIQKLGIAGSRDGQQPLTGTSDL